MTKRFPGQVFYWVFGKGLPVGQRIIISGEGGKTSFLFKKVQGLKNVAKRFIN
jgi:hypothetical protein